jgi:hypothetical protein
MYTQFRSEDLKGKDHSEDLDADGRIILQRILNIGCKRCGLDLSGSGYEPVAGSCEYGNEPSGSIKGRGFLD